MHLDMQIYRFFPITIEHSTLMEKKLFCFRSKYIQPGLSEAHAWTLYYLPFEITACDCLFGTVKSFLHYLLPRIFEICGFPVVCPLRVHDDCYSKNALTH